MLQGNKGEWSEIYTLLKLLSDRKLYVGNENLDKIPDLFYPILKIIRDETTGQHEYSINDDIVIINGSNDKINIPIAEFTEKAEILLNQIKENTNTTFRIPELEDFLNQIRCSTLKASSSQKTDINIKIHDLKTNQEPILGFSIKSQLGNASTLLNAGKTTNFIYKISKCRLTDEEIENINNISTRSKIRDRLLELFQKGCQITFIENENQIFENNLTLIDSLLPDILAEILVLFFSTDKSSISDLVELLKNENPLRYNLSNEHKYYEYKIKKFLTEVALGMMPAKVWDGIYDATGGYLVVKENGDILSYHIYNKNKFEDYLFYNTKLETASSSRHKFGKIYKNDDECFINLNLQIRFKK